MDFHSFTSTMFSYNKKLLSYVKSDTVQHLTSTGRSAKLHRASLRQWNHAPRFLGKNPLTSTTTKQVRWEWGNNPLQQKQELGFWCFCIRDGTPVDKDVWAWLSRLSLTTQQKLSRWGLHIVELPQRLEEAVMSPVTESMVTPLPTYLPASLDHITFWK